MRRDLEERALASHPAPAALLITGSYATGNATPSSDIDLRLLTWGPPDACSTWFVGARSQTLHVSFGTKTVDGWIERGTRVEAWSLGFPARHHARYLWATDQARERLGGDPSQVDHPAASPELEDCFEGVRKALRRGAAGDWRAMRWHARDAAEQMPRLLFGVQEPRGVVDRLDALDAALALRIAPPSWRVDLPVLLGVEPAGDAETLESVRRLGLGLLAFLRANDPEVDDQSGVAAALADGTLERLLARTGMDDG